MDLEHIIIVLAKCTWVIIKTIKEMERGDISIKMELYMMVTGKMVIKRESDAIFMVTEYIWENVT